MFRMRNTLGVEPEQSGEFFETSKKDKFSHGVGVRSMKQSCEKLGGGNITYSYITEHFMLCLYIPHKELKGVQGVVHA